MEGIQPTPLVRAPADAPRMSLDEWVGLPEDERGELVDGRLVEEEEVSALHELVVAWLARTVGNWSEEHDALVLGAIKIAVGTDWGRMPDLAIYLAETALPPAHGAIRKPPDVLIEVVSPTPRDGRRDRIEKFEEYARFGVRWYWIVDPAFRSFEVFELGADGRYTRTVTAVAGVARDIPGLGGLALDLDALWAKADRLG